ncbi:hypothetical protein [Hydrogenophaga sp.]|uniref:hypothetical protein n=1 Tax=Hydrogenophaga sp. TaxID=1904254 RepID=UPI00391D7DF3
MGIHTGVKKRAIVHFKGVPHELLAVTLVVLGQRIPPQWVACRDGAGAVEADPIGLMAQYFSALQVMVTSGVIFFRSLSAAYPEENHEKTQQSGNAVCSRRHGNGRRRSNRRQLA